MCGIAGLLGRQGDESLRLQITGMLGRLTHRGPDDEGTWDDLDRGIALGHRRLAIIDPSPRGHQPMVSDDGDTVITFNGEIYNFRELRAELLARGWTFRSATDTEVVLKAYEAWGLGMLDRLVGMFSFAIWDGGKDCLCLARDRTGEKPLYYACSRGSFAFASELGALAAVPWIDRAVDLEALALYFECQYVPAPLSIYRGVRKLPPAHAMTVRGGNIQTWRYWDPVEKAGAQRHALGDAELLERAEELLREAVRGQMIADVPLGAFLSGGIDSTLVVSQMAQLGGRTVKTFTIGFEAAEYDESVHAGKVAEFLGTEHTCERLTEQDALNLIPRIPGMYGEPFADSSALPTHLVSQVARRHVAVALSGDGGDEAFGGYTRYDWLERAYPWAFLSSPLSRPLRQAGRLASGRAARLLSLAGASPGKTYLPLVSIFSPDQVVSLVGDPPERPEYGRAWSQKGLSLRRRAMLADLITYLPEAILVKVDRAAMATSLETRAPFLDHRLLEFSLRLPLRWVKQKRLLKRLAYRRVPQELLDRPKQGFAVPIGRWFRTELRGMLTDSLGGSALERVGVQDRHLVNRLMTEHLQGTHNHSSRLWALLVLSLWGQGQHG